MNFSAQQSARKFYQFLFWVLEENNSAVLPYCLLMTKPTQVLGSKSFPSFAAGACRRCGSSITSHRYPKVKGSLIIVPSRQMDGGGGDATGLDLLPGQKQTRRISEIPIKHAFLNSHGLPGFTDHTN